MISSKAVNNVHILPESILVIFRAEHRPDLCPSLANVRDVLITEEEMVRGHFTRHREIFLFGSTNDCNLSHTKIEAMYLVTQ